MTENERELALLLISTLQLEDMRVEDVAPDDALFGDYESGWGLDSIDALEIALAVQQHYGVEMRAEDEESRAAFASLRSLSKHIDANRH